MWKRFILFVLGNEEKPINTPTEYNIKLKCQRNSLHTKYLVGISAGICIWFIATGHAKDDSFIAQLSFASTVTSIILSVIAIILSISESGKAEIMEGRLEETVQKLENASEMVKNISESTEKTLNELNSSLRELDKKIEKIPDAVFDRMYSAPMVEEFETFNSMEGVNSSENI